MHGITEIDAISGIEIFWHGKNEIVSPEILNEFENSPWDFPIERKPLRIGNNRATEIVVNASGEVKRPLEAIMAKGNVLNVVAEGNYGDVPMIENWKTIQPLIEEFGFQVVSIGTLFGCKQFFITLEAQDSLFKVGNDDCKARVCFVGSLDGSLSRKWFNSMMRIVCNNTLRASLRALKALNKANKGEILNECLRATKNAPTRIKEYAQRNAGWAAERYLIAEKCEAFRLQSITESEALCFSAALVGGDKLSQRSLNIAQDITERFKGGTERGIGNYGKSRWDLLNGVTEKYTRDASSTPEKSFISSEFGRGATIKEQAFEFLLDDATLEAMTKKGQLMLDRFETEKTIKEASALVV